MIRFDDIEAQFGPPEPYGGPFITKRKLVEKTFFCAIIVIYITFQHIPTQRVDL
jgi:hypothetical protein